MIAKIFVALAGPFLLLVFMLILKTLPDIEITKYFALFLRDRAEKQEKKNEEFFKDL